MSEVSPVVDFSLARLCLVVFPVEFYFTRELLFNRLRYVIEDLVQTYCILTCDLLEVGNTLNL